MLLYFTPRSNGVVSLLRTATATGGKDEDEQCIADARVLRVTMPHIRHVPDVGGIVHPYCDSMTVHFRVSVEEIDPIAGRLERDDGVVEFTGWLDFLRAVSDALAMEMPPP